ncbi:MAG: hypothetical protein OEL87_00045 [Nanoarchaeota archaeon]|nr:hypothetical protein [Nanoarchaeota archaeon]
MKCGFCFKKLKHSKDNIERCDCNIAKKWWKVHDSNKCKQVSFSPEAVEIVNELPRGELSRICNEAILSSRPENLTLNEVNSKIFSLKNDQKTIKKQLKYLKIQQKKLENDAEKEKVVNTRRKEIEEKKLKEVDKKKYEKLLKFSCRLAKSLFEISDEDAINVCKKYHKAKGDKELKGGFADFIEKQNFKRRPKK